MIMIIMMLGRLMEDGQCPLGTDSIHWWKLFEVTFLIEIGQMQRGGHFSSLLHVQIVHGANSASCKMSISNFPGLRRLSLGLFTLPPLSIMVAIKVDPWIHVPHGLSWHVLMGLPFPLYLFIWILKFHCSIKLFSSLILNAILPLLLISSHIMMKKILYSYNWTWKEKFCIGFDTMMKIIWSHVSYGDRTTADVISRREGRNAYASDLNFKFSPHS